MAKKSVLGNPSTISKVGKEGFNMNQVFTFTSSVGQLLPTWYDWLNPGEKISGFPSFLLRSDPFLAPAMADMDVFVDVFFVPMSKIFSPFGEWFYQIDDLRSNFFNASNFLDRLPIVESDPTKAGPFYGMTQSYYETAIYGPSGPDHYFDYFGFGMHRLLSHLGRNPQSIFFGAADGVGDLWLQSDYFSGIVPQFDQYVRRLDSPKFAPYLECTYQAIYMDYFRPDLYESNDINSYNLDRYFNDGTGLIEFGTSSWPSKGIWKLRYRCKSADYFMATKPAPLFAGTSMLPNAAQHLMKVNQWLTDGTQFSLEDPNGYYLDPRSVVSDRIDFRSGGGVTGTDNGTWRTNPNNPLGSALNVRTATSGNYLVQESNPAEIISHTHNVNISSLNASLNTGRLRTMFALEKLAKITYRAGKHYDDQTLAHFGYKVPEGISGEVYHLKSYHSNLVLNKVVSLASTATAELGEMAANGYSMLNGSQEGEFSFTAPCHGIVMSIFSIAPRYKYLQPQDKFGYKIKLWDFFKPSLDNLGMQPLFGYETGMNRNQTQTPSNVVVGWQWRFMEDKVKADKTTLVFATNAKNPWSFTSLAVAGTISNILVCPCDLNLLLNTQYDPLPAWPVDVNNATEIGNYPTVYLRDPFTIDFMMKASKASYMSMFGDTPIGGL